jgi:ABC-type dipeptide/oligopeptide/nickel transport system permease subunit
MSAVAPRVSPWRRIYRVFTSRGLVVFGSVIILALIIVALFAPLIAPYDPYAQNLANALQKPSAAHLLGTDGVGRDTLSRIIYGSRIALLVGIVVTGIAASSGMLLGLLAGYFGGVVNMVIMRFIDALMTFPMMILAMLLMATLGKGIGVLMFALGFAMMSGYARVMCGQVLSVKENDYVLAEHAAGASNLRIMLRHVLPNCFPPFIVLITMQMGTAIMAEAGMSFIGLGVQAPTASWGAMVNDGYKYLLKNPVISIAPGAAILLIVFAFNMVGDGLRDALDPRLRGTI